MVQGGGGRWIRHGRFALHLLWLAMFASYASDQAEASGRPYEENGYFLSVYGGQLTDGDWQDSITGQADFVDSSLLMATVSKTLLRSKDRWWSMELEGGAGRHFGDQKHWEFILPVVSGRCHFFPDNTVLDTSAAFGLGTSYATEVPDQEVENQGESERLLVYWHIDLSAGLPDSRWAVMFRLHHRSTAYGAMGEDGGSNALAAGLRFFF